MLKQFYSTESTQTRVKMHIATKLTATANIGELALCGEYTKPQKHSSVQIRTNTVRQKICIAFNLNTSVMYRRGPNV